MLWLALHLPQLSLEAFCATLPAAENGRPVVLIEAHRVSAANAVALQRGIQPGLKRATALALAGDVLLAQADAVRDAAALQAVVHAALVFTPSVTLQDAQTVLLEVQASLRYFGSLVALLQRLQETLAPLGHCLQLAAAPTALGAALLARWYPAGRGNSSLSSPHSLLASPATTRLAHGPHVTQPAVFQRLLHQAPLQLLEAAQDHAEALQAMGLSTLADVQRLPRAGLTRRFGAALLDTIDRALGTQPDPRTWVALPVVFESRLELFARADTSEQVLAGAAVLLARLVAWAQARQARVVAFTLCMHHEARKHVDNGKPPATMLRVELAEPALDAAHLQLLLRERLAHCQLLAPTLDLQLHCQDVVQAEAPSGELFPTRTSAGEGLTRLLERLRARLGDDAVLCLQAVADHRPERASRAVPVQGAPSAPKPAAWSVLPSTHGAAQPVVAGLQAASAWAALPLHRPAWLLPEPLPLAERDALPLLAGRPLQLLSGPERIEAGWWDGDPVARDYFIALVEDGSLVWVWRNRLPAVSGAPSAARDVHWFLQGRFA